VINLDPSVTPHYLKMSVDLLESADISETRLSTYIAKTIRDTSRAAGITGIGDEPQPVDPPDQVLAQGEKVPSDTESFPQIESQSDLGYLLGLPGDGTAVTFGNGSGLGGSGRNGFTGDFESGLGGMGMVGGDV